MIYIKTINIIWINTYKLCMNLNVNFQGFYNKKQYFPNLKSMFVYLALTCVMLRISYIDMSHAQRDGRLRGGRSSARSPSQPYAILTLTTCSLTSARHFNVSETEMTNKDIFTNTHQNIWLCLKTLYVQQTHTHTHSECQQQGTRTLIGLGLVGPQAGVQGLGPSWRWSVMSQLSGPVPFINCCLLQLIINTPAFVVWITSEETPG